MNDEQLVEFLKNGGYITFNNIDEVSEFYDTIYKYCEKQKVTINETINRDQNSKSDFIAFYDIERLRIDFKYEEESLFLKSNIKLKWSKLKDISFKNNNEKEINMLKLLEMYKNKQKERIIKEYNEVIESVKNGDTITQIIKEMKSQIESIVGDKVNEYSFEFPGLYKEENLKAIKQLYNKKDEELLQLESKIEEIEALLELAPNYEEKVKILRDYDIMDKKKNIIL